MWMSLPSAPLSGQLLRVRAVAAPIAAGDDVAAQAEAQGRLTRGYWAGQLLLLLHIPFSVLYCFFALHVSYMYTEIILLGLASCETGVNP